MDTKLVQKIKQIVRKREKEILQSENKSDIFRLDCNVCGGTKVKLDGNDFEQWDKDLFKKEHKHKIRRFFKKLRR